MKSGEMRHLLTFQTRAESADGIGGFTAGTWSDTFTAWGKVAGVTATERVESMRLTGKVPVRFIVYYDPDINADLRVKHSPDGTARYYTIRSVTDFVGQRRTMHIDAVEDTDA